MSRYESHAGLYDENKPFNLFPQYVRSNNFVPHWHEHIELLYIVEGSGSVISDRMAITPLPGQIIVINSNALHRFAPIDYLKYYCLIIDKNFLEKLNLEVEEMTFQSLIDAPAVVKPFKHMIKEYTEQKEYYKESMKADIISIMVELARNHTVFQPKQKDAGTGRKLEIAKKIIQYINRHYKEPLSIEEIAKAVGFSRYYASHVFKEVIGCTLIDYINRQRCNHAKTLLASGQYTVSQTAELCGFLNLSYFTRTYKKQMGILPRETKTV